MFATNCPTLCRPSKKAFSFRTAFAIGNLRCREFVPQDVYSVALRGLGSAEPPTTGWGVYRRYVETEYLRPIVVIPVFLVVFVTLMYLLGSLLPRASGRWCGATSRT